MRGAGGNHCLGGVVAGLGGILLEVGHRLVLVQEGLELVAQVLAGLGAGVGLIGDGGHGVESLGGFLLVDLQQLSALVACEEHKVVAAGVGNFVLGRVGRAGNLLPQVFLCLSALDGLGHLVGGLAAIEHSQCTVLCFLVAGNDHHADVDGVERHALADELVHLVAVVHRFVALGGSDGSAGGKFLDRSRELVDGVLDGVDIHLAQNSHAVDAGAFLQGCPCLIGHLSGGCDVGLRRSDVDGDVVHAAGLLLKAEHGFEFVPFGFDFGVADGIFVIGERCEVLFDKVDAGGGGLVLGHLRAVQVVGLDGAGQQGLQFVELNLLCEVLFELVPLLPELNHLRFLSAHLGGIGDELIELCGRLGTHLLCKLDNCRGGVFANHELADFVVAHIDTHFFVLLLEQRFVDHLFEHLLLAGGCVDLTVLVLVLRGLLLHAFLEGHDVDFLTAHFHSGAVACLASECLDSHLDDESEKSGANHNGKNFLSLPNFL